MPKELRSNAERLRAEWEAYVRRWKRYRAAALGIFGAGLLLVFLHLFWPGVGVIFISVVAYVSFLDFSRRERAHWELLGPERRGEFANGGGRAEDGRDPEG